MVTANLLLIRHGEAVDHAPGLGDAGRWLTAHGRATTREVAKHLDEHCAPAALWSSPLVRAVQTAEILAERLRFDGEVAVLRELASGDLDALVAKVLAHDGPRPLALVGHEPSLSNLAVRLLGIDGARWPGFKKSGVCALAWEGRDDARFAWMLTPRHLKVVKKLEEL